MITFECFVCKKNGSCCVQLLIEIGINAKIVIIEKVLLFNTNEHLTRACLNLINPDIGWMCLKLK
jgi:hypothetical protein